ncbi:ATP phosphoribosyltransferase regulatory subunit [Nitrospirillum sp. BR 11163]|uniref:ATP phosphoribosyltransferase regulatory subunit n=1 Tax=Nitrospirillum sp. BR 11163 TaxID=3104323 RepID=UPI002AFFD37B|nr:ATP phosphoribosyltransferase regulatory subunit [Nitrospirillum sp. BR 11163]MEA1674527.1 ATP phosphoribosyltransferase regulatory subunit [Nitrospirillum sp. BR 11163]
MTDSADEAIAAKALLPAGLRDLLPPAAQHEARIVEQLMADFGRHGYDRVKPPLIEFEEGLLAGPGAKLAHQTFRLMDPVSQRMMGLRADMTLQVARIAQTRLGKAPRPLRLSYAGQVLRVKGSQLRHERQFGQVGVELVGSLRAEADAEIVLLATEALTNLGAEGLTVDLTVPTLVPALFRSLGLDEATQRAAREALDHRDAAGLAAIGGAAAELLGRVMACCGNAPAAVEALAAVELPAEAEPERQRLATVVNLIVSAAPHVQITIDPVEQRGFEYQTGVSFTIFARGVRGEIGRGGRYRTLAGEPATGFTLFTDTVIESVPGPAPARRLLLPHGTPAAQAQRLREKGWDTVAALEPLDDDAAEAKRLGCSHLLRDGWTVEV